jgi:hypothetical protein
LSVCGRSLRRLGALGLSGLVGWTSVAEGQVRLEVAPLIGAYASLSSFESPLSPPREFWPQSRRSLSQGAGLALGLQATCWPGSSWGLRVHGSSSASSVKLADQARIIGRPPERARVTVLGAEAILPVSRLESGTTVSLSAGGALVHRGGEAYRGHTGTSDLAGALGFDSQVPIARRFSLEADARLLVYRLALTDSTGAAYRPGTQADLQAHLGLVVRLGAEVER